MIERISDQLREGFNRKLSGIGVVEVILILLVLVGLVIIFKDQITALAKTIFSSIGSQVNQL
ncbi:MAG: hypothetical protein IJM53_05020 [Lachnospiraceae bacterium]|nr:hypothetical protein [Lachnospiraceae bacterium]MBR6349689.1 hypothetical protein [Lachnospiraceae bacterium]